MRAASLPRPAARLLVVDRTSGSRTVAAAGDLPAFLRAGDLLVVNDAATLPASLAGRTARGEALELRLLGETPERTWRAVLFGAGDWRTRTEDRPAPPPVAAGDVLAFGPGLGARVLGRLGVGRRALEIRFDREGDALWAALYAVGRPVQYSYLSAAVPLHAVQTAYASRPWAVEPPSAGLGLNWDVLQRVRARGACLARLTHAAGLSATGDPALDAVLPLPERYEIPAETADAVRTTRERGGRVVAVGTTVVRALESAADGEGGVRPGPGVATLRLGRGGRVSVVDALLTGIHEPGVSHHELMRAFLSDAELMAAQDAAEGAGFLVHEFGDLCLVA